MKSIQLEFGSDSKRSLFDEVLDMWNLRKAFKLVKRNRGVPGIDGTTIESYEENLEEELGLLRQEVMSWTYKPTPVRRVEIPKPNGKGTRNLGMPTVKDRVLHMAIKLVIEPRLEPKFSNNSYGFRPGRNQQQAVQIAKRIVESGKEFVVDIDLSKFFDRINHDKLIHRLKGHIEDKRILRLIGMILRSGVMINGIRTSTTERSVQGSPLSPLLSNVVLDELDKELEKRGLEFCRFADDCNIFVKTKRAADRIMKSRNKFTIAVPVSNKWEQNAIDDIHELIHGPEGYRKLDDEILYVHSRLHPWGENNRRCYRHLYYNAHARAIDIDRFNEKLLTYKSELESGKLVKDHQEAYDTFFVIKTTPKRGTKVSYNSEAVSRYINPSLPLVVT